MGKFGVLLFSTSSVVRVQAIFVWLCLQFDLFAMPKYEHHPSIETLSRHRKQRPEGFPALEVIYDANVASHLRFTPTSFDPHHMLDLVPMSIDRCILSYCFWDYLCAHAITWKMTYHSGRDTIYHTVSLPAKQGMAMNNLHSLYGIHEGIIKRMSRLGICSWMKDRSIKAVHTTDLLDDGDNIQNWLFHVKAPLNSQDDIISLWCQTAVERCITRKKINSCSSSNASASPAYDYALLNDETVKHLSDEQIRELECALDEICPEEPPRARMLSIDLPEERENELVSKIKEQERMINALSERVSTLESALLQLLTSHHSHA